MTFLGTGTSQGVPFIGCPCEVCQSQNPKDKRLRTSIHVHLDGKSFLIDTGPDFRTQMLSNDIKHVDFVLYTHSHKDHIAGLDDLKAYNYWQNQEMDIYANDFTIRRIKTEFDYVFQEFKYPGIPDIKAHIIHHNDVINIQGIDITPIKVLHLKMEVYGFRMKDFTYITDANFISEEEKSKIKGSKVLVLNALRHEKHISHFTLQEAIDLAQELEIPEVYFTHMSHQLGLHNEIQKNLPAHMKLAYDGLKINI